MKISATTVMLPELDVRLTCYLLHRLGFDGVEWRVRRLPKGQEQTPPSPWGRHVSDLSPENIQARSGELLNVCRAYGLAMPVFASACTADDHEQIDLLAEGAASCGCPAIRLSCPRGYDGSVGYHELYDEAVRAFQGALAITRPRGIKVLIETHGGTIHLSASLAYRLVSNFDPEDIGVIYDPQNMVKDGFETTKLALDMLGGYLAHLHVGGHRPEPGPVDDRGTQQWIWRAVPMGMGLYDYPELIRALKAVGYRGFVSIEDFATDRSAEAKLKDGIRYLRSL
ncbi:MAG: sugar phosphate isomerase/epimerase [Armatimonadetes bacterium]|nr:sugar phosphate isomerase/epimerase [Armatimonadota bacterium]